MSNETYHIPVMLEECIEALEIKPNGTYIDLDSGTVLLGSADGFHMVADSTELGFYQGQTRVAYVSNEMLYVPLAVGVNAIQVGDGENTSWQWKLRRNGNFQLKYVGAGE